MRSRLLKLFAILPVISAGFIIINLPARADVAEMKKYKEAFPETKPKCINCHVAELPKKEEAAHEWNDYGKAVMAQVAKDGIKGDEADEPRPTPETYTRVGKIEDFKK